MTWIDQYGKPHTLTDEIREWMKEAASEYEEPFDLAADTAGVFNCWEALAGPMDVPAELLEYATSLFSGREKQNDKA